MCERQHAAVIGAVEDKDMRAARERARGGQSVQVALGAGVAEADHVARREPRADQLGKLGLIGVRRAERGAALQRALDRSLDHRMRMPVEPGRVFAEEVQIGVAVEVEQARAHRRAPW